MSYSARQLGYARTILAVGLGMGVSVRGIKIGLATGLVETNLLNYANRAVPGSLTVPYDAIGSDSKSVGVMQQQPQWWGRGDGIDLMDVATAARLFFVALKLLPYDDTTRTPGSFAQTVQRSSFPDRYDQRYKDAEALYELVKEKGDPVSFYDVDWSPRFGFGRTINTANLIGVCLHTTESAKEASARDVTEYQIRSESGSYNTMSDDKETILQNTDNWQTWSTGNKGNEILLHHCFVGKSAWSRAEWLRHESMLRRSAVVVAHWCKKYGWPVRQVNVHQLPGITTHRDTQAWGGTDHTDPGPNFPWDVFLRYVREVNTPVAPKPVPPITEGFLMALTDSEQRELYDAICHPRPSLVEGSTAQFDHATYAQLTDAATFRTEQAVENIGQRLARIEKKLEAK